MDYDLVLQEAIRCLNGQETLVSLHPMVYKDLWMWVKGFVTDEYLKQYVHYANSDYQGLAECVIDKFSSWGVHGR